MVDSSAATRALIPLIFSRFYPSRKFRQVTIIILVAGDLMVT